MPRAVQLLQNQVLAVVTHEVVSINFLLLRARYLVIVGRLQQQEVGGTVFCKVRAYQPDSNCN